MPRADVTLFDVFQSIFRNSLVVITQHMAAAFTHAYHKSHNEMNDWYTMGPWRHNMETLSALLVRFDGNISVSNELKTKPLLRSSNFEIMVLNVGFNASVMVGSRTLAVTWREFMGSTP